MLDFNWFADNIKLKNFKNAKNTKSKWVSVERYAKLRAYRKPKSRNIFATGGYRIKKTNRSWHEQIYMKDLNLSTNYSTSCAIALFCTVLPLIKKVKKSFNSTKILFLNPIIKSSKIQFNCLGSDCFCNAVLSVILGTDAAILVSKLLSPLKSKCNFQAFYCINIYCYSFFVPNLVSRNWSVKLSTE